MVFEDIINVSKKTGYRGLLVYTGISGLKEAVEEVKRFYNRILVVAEYSENINGTNHRGVMKTSPRKVRSLLGYEFDSIIIDVSHGLRPNVLGITCEMIRRGGVLLLASTQCYSDLRLGLPYGKSTYTRYVKESFKESRLVKVYDKCSERTIVERLEITHPTKARRKPRKPSGKIPVKISRLIATQSQLEFVERFLEFLRKPDKLLIGIGDRGRGKSAGLGIALALGLGEKYYSEVPIVAVEPYGIQSLMKLLSKTLTVLGYRHKRVYEKNLVTEIKGRDFQFIYYKPWELERGYRIIAIDEAASIGVSRLRRLLSQSRKIVATTTIHGYEGSGRSSLKTIKKLVKHYTEALFEEPVRYLENDPLEEWLYNTFMLNAEPVSIDKITGTRYLEADTEDLAKNKELLRQLYGILVLAHYRNEPDDLALLLDHPKHFIRVLVNQDSQPIAVAQISVEEPLTQAQIEEIFHRGGIPGVLLKDKIIKYGIIDSSKLKVWRIVRIAVLPEHQNKGYGTRLLENIEEEAIKNRIDAVGAIFSGHESLSFWLKNNYKPYYISPRYNRITGEKNIAVIKSFNNQAGTLIEEALKIFKKKLLLSAHNIYRDLALEKIGRILASLNVEADIGMKLTDDELRRLEIYYNEGLLYESVQDILYKTVLIFFAENKRLPFSDNELLVIVGRTLQGKTLNEIARILGLKKQRVEEIVEKTHRKISKYYLSGVENNLYFRKLLEK